MNWCSRSWCFPPSTFLSSIDRQHTKSGSLRGRQAPFAGGTPRPQIRDAFGSRFQGVQGGEAPLWQGSLREAETKLAPWIRCLLSHTFWLGFSDRSCRRHKGSRGAAPARERSDRKWIEGGCSLSVDRFQRSRGGEVWATPVRPLLEGVCGFQD